VAEASLQAAHETSDERMRFVSSLQGKLVPEKNKQKDKAFKMNFAVKQGWTTGQRPIATFLTVLPQRVTLYIWTHKHHPICSSLRHIPFLF